MAATVALSAQSGARERAIYTSVVDKNGEPVTGLGAGDFVGEISLLEETPRTATVTAKTPLRFFVLTPRDFRQVVDENPSVERKVLRALARRVLELSRDPTLA